MDFCSNGPCESVNVPAKFEVRSWDNSDRSFGLVLRTPNLGEEEAKGHRVSGMVPFERAFVSSIGPP